MALKANYEFLFVGRDDNSFLENYYYDFFEEMGEKSGQIFINLEVQNNPVDAEEIGSVLFEAMQQNFFKDVNKDPYERFEDALKHVNELLNKFKEQKFSGYIGNLNVIIAAIVGDQLHLAAAGDAEAYLIRKKYVSVVSEGLADEAKEDEIFSTIASGTVEAGDFVLFSSTRLVRYISKTDLAKCINQDTVMNSLNELKDTVSSEILGRVALTGIRLGEVADEEVVAVSEEISGSQASVLESGVGGNFRGQAGFVDKIKNVFSGIKLPGISGKRRPEVVRGHGNFFSGLMEKGKGAVSGIGRMNASNMKTNKLIWALVVLIVVLLVGILVARGKSATREEIAALDETLNNVQERIEQAETTGSYDKEQAKEILDSAYLDALSVLNSGYYREKAKIFLVKIDEIRDSLDNVERISNPTVVADLTTKRPDVDALGVVKVGDRVFAYEYNALYEIVLDQVQDPLTIDDEEVVISATPFEDRNSVVFLTKSGKLIEYKDGNMSFMDTEDGSFRKGVAVADWSNRIYLLDPTENQVWRYTYRGLAAAFGIAEAYISDGTDFSGAVDFAIDGAVYVLNGNGEISKFYAGTKQDFQINNAPFNALKDPTKIYTSDEVDQVYVLDSQEGRVLVFDKITQSGNLTYSKQYLFEGQGELRDLYVDPVSRKLFVLSTQKLLEVDL